MVGGRTFGLGALEHRDTVARNGDGKRPVPMKTNHDGALPMPRPEVAVNAGAPVLVAAVETP